MKIRIYRSDGVFRGGLFKTHIYDEGGCRVWYGPPHPHYGEQMIDISGHGNPSTKHSWFILQFSRDPDITRGTDLPPDKEKALNLALNKVQGAWDEGKLALLLEELIETPDLDLALTGFDLDEATGLIDKQFGDLPGDDDENFDFDAELDRTDPPVTQRGDLVPRLTYTNG